MSVNDTERTLHQQRLTIGKQSVAVSVVESGGGGKLGGGRVAVAQVVSTRDLAQVGGLVKGGGSLVLGVAGF